MAKIRIIWTVLATFELYETLDYYTFKNKSKIYSAKLHKEIQNKLNKLDFFVTSPPRTTKPDVFYFTHKHISVFFSFQDNTIFVKSLSDDRRNPSTIEMFLRNID